MDWLKHRILWLCGLLLIHPTLYAAEVVTVYTYHLMPPYTVDLRQGTGLYYDFTRLLNQHTDTYHFKLQYIPRKRLNRLLEDNEQAMVIGVNPVWFQDKEEQKYFWTTALLDDRDEVVSNADNPIEYKQPDSLKNLIMGGVHDFYYRGVDEIVDNGQILRYDTTREVNNLKKLRSKRIDFTIISQYTLSYIIEKQQWQDSFHVSEQPHDTFKRRILVTKSQPKLYEFLTQHVEMLVNSNEWQQLLAHYPVNPN